VLGSRALTGRLLKKTHMLMPIALSFVERCAPHWNWGSGVVE